MKPVHCTHILALGSLAILLLAAGGCGPEINGFQPATEQAQATINLFNLALVLSLIVFLLVAGLLTYVVVRYRSRPGDEEPPQIATNRKLEIAWTITPVLLLAGLFSLTLPVMLFLEERAADPLRIEVIGHQYWWEFNYPDLGIDNANELHVPVGRPIQFDLRGADVIHSFWVPEFSRKMDTIPGQWNTMTITIENPGRYRGVCGEFCGTQHAWMQFVVVAHEPADFDAWVRDRQEPVPPPDSDLAERGREIYLQNTCVNCHGIPGETAAQVGPDLTHFGSRSIIGAGVMTNTPENLKRWITNLQEIKPGALMPSYNFSEEDLNALVAYLEGLE